LKGLFLYIFSKIEMKLNVTVELLHTLFPEAIWIGTLSGSLSGIASLEEAKAGDISFLGNPKYRSKVPTSKASLILVPLDFNEPAQEGQVLLRLENPSSALARICAYFEHQLFCAPQSGVHPSSVIESSAVIDSSASIGPFCTIGAGAVIEANVVLVSHIAIGNHARVGSHSWLMPRVTLADYCQLGNRVRLHSGVVIGSDGFGYTQEGSGGSLHHVKIPQLGSVVVEDDVEIGANSTIDRARFGETRIGKGTKIDNLVQIGHNCQIGRHCIIVSQSGIAGSTCLEDYVVLWGQSAVAGHLTIGQGTQVMGRAGVTKSVPRNSRVNGVPAVDIRQYMRQEALQRKLPDLFKKVAKLEEMIGNSSDQ
jgi:UDP-3-O-[3-hydroxymyristoyl] glucosamine N-acyltransferase